MNLSNLKPAEGSTKTRKRIGRGTEMCIRDRVESLLKLKEYLTKSRKKHCA